MRGRQQFRKFLLRPNLYPSRVPDITDVYSRGELLMSISKSFLNGRKDPFQAVPPVSLVIRENVQCNVVELGTHYLLV